MSTTPAPKDPKEAALEAQAAHYALLEQLDNHSVHKNFRSATWKPNQRRNKNIKTILGDAQRRADAAANANANNTNASVTGASTPLDNTNNNPDPTTAAEDTTNNNGLSTSGTNSPDPSAATPPGPNLAQASRSLSKLVLEKSLNTTNKGTNGTTTAPPGGVGATYTNIESAPSLAPQRRYCDVTGLPARYTDPKTRLRYHDAEVFGMIRGLPQGYAENYLEARGAHTVLK